MCSKGTQDGRNSFRVRYTTRCVAACLSLAVFHSSNSRTVRPTPIRDMDICPRFFVFVLSGLGRVGPANQNRCIILSVGNLRMKSSGWAFNEVSRMKFLGTVIHRLTELLPNHCQHRGNLYHNYIFK
jgi:hypothetical protein